MFINIVPFLSPSLQFHALRDSTILIAPLLRLIPLVSNAMPLTSGVEIICYKKYEITEKSHIKATMMMVRDRRAGTQSNEKNVLTF
jgi:hypothetical protein